MTRAQIAAARERVAVLLRESLEGTSLELITDQFCGRLVSAVLGHPDGKAPRQPAGAGRKARRFAR